MRHRLEPLRGLWLFAGSLCAWLAFAMPRPWSWSLPAALVAMAFVPRSRGTRAALATGAILQAAIQLASWQDVPPRRPVTGSFAIEIRREVKAGRYEAGILQAPPGVPTNSVVRVALDQAGIGDRIVGRGTLRPPRPPQNPGGFDEARWSASAGLAGSLHLDGTPRTMGRNEGLWNTFCHELDRHVRETLSRRLDAPSADLWIATLLADGSRLPADVNTAFRQTGLYHMLSVSGFHLVVLGGATILLLSLLRAGPVVSSTLALGVVWLYIALLGFPDPAVRSGVAFTGFVLARWTGRRAHAANALGLGGALLLLLDPNSLFQAGVQLTLVATAALVWIAPGLEALLLPRRGPAWTRSVLKGVLASVAATLATSPILAWNTGLVPWIGIPAGLLAGGFFSAGFLASLGVALLGALPDWCSVGFAGASELCARAVLEIALRAGSWEAGWFEVVRPRIGFLVLWILALCLVAGCALGRNALRRSLVGLVCLLPLFVLEGIPLRTEPVLRLTFLAVGQGDATLIRAPDGTAWLVDGGPRGFGPAGRDAGRDIVVPALRALRVEHLSGQAVTHPDLDHWGGVPAIADRFPPSVLLEPSIPNPEPSQGWDAARRAILRVGTRPLGEAFGQNLSIGDRGALVCVAPGKGETIPERNAASLVLSVRWGRARALLTGDAEHWTEDRMLEARADLRADLLKVGHHGSKGASSLPFLRAVQPRWAVLSCGEKNRYGHPHRETLERLDSVGAQVLDTREGAWEARLHDDGRIEVAPAQNRWWRGPWEARLSFP